jgi:bifunctional DNA-binding transcriptional regulator/antitoxin component of YhaV-PrlF toxin-antitoxin module
MKLETIKIEGSSTSFRITIPHKVIKSIRWKDVSHLTLEVLDDNTLILRRFIDGKALKGD